MDNKFVFSEPKKAEADSGLSAKTSEQLQPHQPKFIRLSQKDVGTTTLRTRKPN